MKTDLSMFEYLVGQATAGFAATGHFDEQTAVKVVTLAERVMKVMEDRAKKAPPAPTLSESLEKLPGVLDDAFKKLK